MTKSLKSLTGNEAPALRPEIVKALALIDAAAQEKKTESFAAEVAAFLVNVVADIDWLMKDKAVSQAELARRLGCSEARVSKLIGGGKSSANMTAATMARVMAALGEKLEISTHRLDELKGKNLKSPDYSCVIASGNTARYAFQLKAFRAPGADGKARVPSAGEWSCAGNGNSNGSPTSANKLDASVAAAA